jgi:hypothetical protein
MAGNKTGQLSNTINLNFDRGMKKFHPCSEKFSFFVFSMS